MKRNQSAEDYLEGILLLSRESEFVHRVDLARKIGVLQAESLVECDGLHIYLTAKGAVYAEEIYERHCVIREFLALLGVNSDDAEADACEMEHVVSSATFEAIKKFVENNKK